jgi:hypothetical protein
MNKSLLSAIGIAFAVASSPMMVGASYAATMTKPAVTAIKSTAATHKMVVKAKKHAKHKKHAVSPKKQPMAVKKY